MSKCMLLCSIDYSQGTLFMALSGDPSVISPPSSASVHAVPSNSGPQSLVGPGQAMSPGTASIRQRLQEARVNGGSQGSASSSGKMKDSGVGPDVPEIQSPRKGWSAGDFSFFLFKPSQIGRLIQFLIN